MIVHRIDCASLERTSACTCGADRLTGRGWWPVGLAVLAFAVAAAVVWLW